MFFLLAMAYVEFLSVFLQVAGCGPPVVFVHGFGASIGHFRKNIPALSQSYKVYSQFPQSCKVYGSSVSSCNAACQSLSLGGHLVAAPNLTEASVKICHYEPEFSSYLVLSEACLE